MMNLFKDISSELKLVFSNKNLFDIFVSPFIFVITNILFNLNTAITIALIISIITIIYRAVKKQKIIYPLLGFFGVFMIFIFIFTQNEQRLFFAPSIVTGVFISLACLVSILVKKPIVAYTSLITRRWPIKWYWHPKVRPAYTEVTIFWFLFFVIKVSVQVEVFLNSSLNSLVVINFILGWPSTLLVLIFSYFYGLWRLRKLKGPSVEEFKQKTKPPWKGQVKGF